MPVPWFCAPGNPCHSPQDGSRWTQDAEILSKHQCANWSAIVHSINSSLMRPSMSPCMEGASLAQSINQSVYQSFDQSIIHATTSRDSLHSIRRNGHCGGIGAQRKKRVKAAAKPSGRAVIPKRLTIMTNASPTSPTTQHITLKIIQTSGITTITTTIAPRGQKRRHDNAWQGGLKCSPPPGASLAG